MKKSPKTYFENLLTSDVPVAKSKSGESVSCVEERMPMPDNSTHIVPFFADLKFELAGFPKRTKKVKETKVMKVYRFLKNRLASLL